MIQRDHPFAIALAHQSCIDAVLTVTGAIEAIVADELRGVGRQAVRLEPQFEGARIAYNAIVQKLAQVA